MVREGEESMTPEQEKAWKFPCLLAMETSHPRYAHHRPLRRYTLVLTLNTGYE